MVERSWVRRRTSTAVVVAGPKVVVVDAERFRGEFVEADLLCRKGEGQVHLQMQLD